MSENEKTPTDAGTPVETEIAADEQTPDAGGQATTKGAPATASATPAATESSAAEQRGEVIGERLAALEAEEKANAATPEGEKADRKKHVGVIVAAVVFAVLLIGAGVAYSVLAPTVDDKQIEVTGTDAVQETEVDATADADVSDDTGDGNGANAATTPAPDFTMTDADGATLTLADFKGKPVLLNFWVSWCGPCASEMPDIQSAWEEHGNDVEFVIVNMTDMNGETEQSAKAFLAENNYTFPCYFDANNSAAHGLRSELYPADLPDQRRGQHHRRLHGRHGCLSNRPGHRHAHRQHRCPRCAVDASFSICSYKEGP